MITLKKTTIARISIELESIPEKYQKPFNSIHEGLGVLREEYIELEDEIFFGEKRAKSEYENDIDREWAKEAASELHKKRIREEAVQVAAMAVWIIQELT